MWHRPRRAANCCRGPPPRYHGDYNMNQLAWSLFHIFFAHHSFALSSFLTVSSFRLSSGIKGRVSAPLLFSKASQLQTQAVRGIIPLFLLVTHS